MEPIVTRVYTLNENIGQFNDENLEKYVIDLCKDFYKTAQENIVIDSRLNPMLFILFGPCGVASIPIINGISENKELFRLFIKSRSKNLNAHAVILITESWMLCVDNHEGKTIQETLEQEGVKHISDHPGKSECAVISIRLRNEKCFSLIGKIIRNGNTVFLMDGDFVKCIELNIIPSWGEEYNGPKM